MTPRPAMGFPLRRSASACRNWSSGSKPSSATMPDGPAPVRRSSSSARFPCPRRAATRNSTPNRCRSRPDWLLVYKAVAEQYGCAFAAAEGGLDHPGTAGCGLLSLHSGSTPHTLPEKTAELVHQLLDRSLYQNMKKAGKIACPFLFLHLTPQEHGCGSDEFPVSFRGLTGAVLPGGEDHSAADISGWPRSR